MGWADNRDMKTILYLALGAIVLSGCGESGSTADAVTTVSTLTLKSTDASGVASADCPTGSAITGGGCHCSGAGAIFGSAPAGNSYICGCVSGTVDAYAICGGTASAKFKTAFVVKQMENDAMDMVKRFMEQRASLLLIDPVPFDTP